MKTLIGIAASTLLIAFAVPASAASPQCGLYGMTCPPASKTVVHTSGVKSKECGLYGMSCAPASKEVKYTTGMKSKECGQYGMACAPMAK